MAESVSPGRTNPIYVVNCKKGVCALCVRLSSEWPAHLRENSPASWLLYIRGLFHFLLQHIQRIHIHSKFDSTGDAQCW